MLIYVLYYDGKLKGGIKALESSFNDDNHDTHIFTLYNGEIWKTYGPLTYDAAEAGGSYYIDSGYSWRLK